MIDAGYNYERLAGKMAWPGIAPQSIRHILITHQDTDWKTSRFRRCRKRCKGIRGSAVTLGGDHVQGVFQRAEHGSEIFARRLFRARQIDDKAAAARTGDGA